MKNELMDAIKGFVYVVLFIIIIYGLGSLMGWAIGSAAKEYSTPKQWYCIEGKVYEKLGDYYSTVVPARACVPVDKD